MHLIGDAFAEAHGAAGLTLRRLPNHTPHRQSRRRGLPRRSLSFPVRPEREGFLRKIPMKNGDERNAAGMVTCFHDRTMQNLIFQTYICNGLLRCLRRRTLDSRWARGYRSTRAPLGDPFPPDPLTFHARRGLNEGTQHENESNDPIRDYSFCRTFHGFERACGMQTVRGWCYPRQ